MNGRRPEAPEGVIGHLRASLADRAGDFSVTPAFAERVQRLRRRRHLMLRAVQSTAVVAVIALAGAGIYESLRPSQRMEFVSPPPASASATPGVPSPEPSASPLDDPSPESEVPQQAPPRPETVPAPDIAPPQEDEGSGIEEGDGTGGSEGDGSGGADPPATRILLDGEPRPGAVCREPDGVVIATIDLPEAETAYVIDLTEPATMRIMSEGVTDVSDTVEVATTDSQTIYTATFATDNNDFLVNEVRVEGPIDPPAC